jgi:hypothetical protein
MMVSSAGRGGANLFMPQSIFISAGEASGEHYGALLADALKKRLDAAGQTAWPRPGWSASFAQKIWP